VDLSYRYADKTSRAHSTVFIGTRSRYGQIGRPPTVTVVATRVGCNRVVLGPRRLQKTDSKAHRRRYPTAGFRQNCADRRFARSSVRPLVHGYNNTVVTPPRWRSLSVRTRVLPKHEFRIAVRPGRGRTNYPPRRFFTPRDERFQTPVRELAGGFYIIIVHAGAVDEQNGADDGGGSRNICARLDGRERGR